MRPARAGEPRAGRPARWCDRTLDFGIAALAAWTAVYTVCLVLRASVTWAVVASALLLVPAGWLAFGRRAGDPRSEWPAKGAPAGPGLDAHVALIAGCLLTAALAAVLFAFTQAPFAIVLGLWIAAAAFALAATELRRRRGTVAEPPLPARRRWLEPAVVAAWALGLAVLSLFLNNGDQDDTYYVHLSAWTAAHGTFPLRDVLYSQQVLPALYYPPVFSYEALVGTIARLTSTAPPDVAYLGVPPVAAAASVLAFWRLLRAWRTPAVPVALSVAMVFLLFDADGSRWFGSFFVSRIWQGKVLFLVIVVPLLFTFLHEYVERPTRRRLALLVCAGAAGVGLSTTAIFVMPVIALGCLAPVAVRWPGRASAGLVAAVAYPAGAAAVTLAVGGRTPDVYHVSQLIPSALVHYVLGTGVMALLAMAAVLAAPALLRAPRAGQMVAAVALLVGCLYLPRVPVLIFDLTGLGRVLWRLTWALPAAALLGALATSLPPWRGRPLLRLLPAAAVCAVAVGWGVPLWSVKAGAVLASHPVWKRDAGDVRAAREILARARPGDMVLAPAKLNQTLAVMSGTVTLVSARPFYTRALAKVPAAHVALRARLQRFANVGIRAAGPAPPAASARPIRRALRALDVDLACVRRAHHPAQRVLARSGYVRVLLTGGWACLRARA